MRWRGVVTLLTAIALLGGLPAVVRSVDDTDADGVVDTADNCPAKANADQADGDADGIGDACDVCVALVNPAQVDSDGDGFGNGCDVCPDAADSTQADADGDGRGDACDACADSPPDVPQTDGSTRLRVDDTGCSISQRCPCAGPVGSLFPWRRHGFYVRCVRRIARRWARDEWIDFSERVALVNRARAAACGGPRVTPGDSDGDGVRDDGDESLVVGDRRCGDGQRTQCDDNCPRTWNPRQKDLDGDGRGDACDADLDGDGIATASDNCPRIANKTQVDADDDGVGDECDKCGTTPAGEDVDTKGCAERETTGTASSAG